jgi:hypothetical protein
LDVGGGGDEERLVGNHFLGVFVCTGMATGLEVADRAIPHDVVRGQIGVAAWVFGGERVALASEVDVSREGVELYGLD